MAEIPPSQFVAYPRGPEDPRQYHGDGQFRISALNEAWLIYKGDMATWMLGYFLILVLAVAVQSPASFYAMWRISSGGGPVAVKTLDVVAVTLLFGILSSIASGLLHAGYYRIILQRMRMIPEGVGGIFSLNGQGLSIALWSFLINMPTLVITTWYNASVRQPQYNGDRPDIAAMLAPMFLYFGGLMVISLLIFPFLLTPWIMVDQKLGIGAAAKRSWQTITSKYFSALGFIIVISLVGASGILACGIGVIFTLPLFSLSLAVIYRDFFMPPIVNRPYGYEETPSPQIGPTG